MAAEFTIQQVVSTGQPWSNDYGTFTPYELVLAGSGAPNVTVQLNRKHQDGAVPEDKVPKEGEVLYGTIHSTQHGHRFKAEQRDGAPPAQQSNGGKPDEAYWEARNRAIQRQHSQEMALRAIGLTGQTATGDALRDAIKQWADWFDNDVRHVQGAAIVEQTAPSPQPTPDEQIPF